MSSNDKDKSTGSEQKTDTSDDKNTSQGNDKDAEGDKDKSAESEQKTDTSGDDDGEGEGEDSKGAAASGGRNVTGPEKFVEVGGSGGATVHKAHGVEAMVHH